jgi:methionine aminotransferase
VDFARSLTREAKIASIPVSVFCAAPGDERLLRFCFAKDTATLEAAAEVLCRI